MDPDSNRPSLETASRCRGLRRNEATLILCFVALSLSSCMNGGSSRSTVTIDGVSYSIARSGESAERVSSGGFAEAAVLEIENHLGQVNVVTSDQPGWEWHLTCWADRLEDAERLCQEIRLEQSIIDGRSKLRLALPDGAQEFNGFQSDLTLRVPHSMALRIKSHFSRVKIEDRSAQVDIDASFSPLEIRNVRAPVVAKTSFAAVDVQEVESLDLTHRHGMVRVQRVSGSLRVDNRHGGIDVNGVSGAARLTTSHGPIVLNEVEGEAIVKNRFDSVKIDGMCATVHVDVAHGDVSLVLRNSALVSVIAEARFANIEVALPAGVKAYFGAQAQFGGVSTDFSGADLSEREGEAAPGHAEVRLSTTHGDITVRDTTF